MELIYQGKTKDVYRKDANHVVLKFKDDVTGEDGVFDPGANTVGLTIAGVGRTGLRMTQFFFQKLQKAGVPTHFIEANLNDVTMTVKDAVMFGNGLEVICRYRAVGSFYRRYGAYCEEGQSLDGFIEVTLKDDERQDPPISDDALAELHIMSKEAYKEVKQLTKQIASIVKEELAKRELELYDIKLEFGKDKNTGEIMLIDEISGGNMRVYKNNTYIKPMELEQLLFD
ncbi:phosphoribosylaminoimidazolesuccinocarboxamide synthase [Virgibacillus sp. W0430]|uniref:phosphoribosylaminoimidazolesuccinocarboxamide synthase n=1 Tax=Virgibacillus sp. W0430 TaxID=3391580 RepID=UPI003F482D10